MPSVADADVEAGGVSLYTSKVLAAVQADQAQLEQLSTYNQQLQTTCELLSELPNKLQHKLTVPFGRHAFFPGVLQHTNEVHVHLGANYYLNCTAHEAKGILERRMQRLAEAMSAAQKKIEQHQARLSASQSALVPGVGPDGAPVLEIRESYEDSETLLASARRQQAEAPAAAAVSAAHQPPGASAQTSSSAPQPQQVLGASMRSDLKQQVGPTAKQASEHEFAQLFARLDELEALEAEAEANDEAQPTSTEEDASKVQGSTSTAASLGATAGSRGSAAAATEMASDAEPDSDDEDDGVDWAAAFTPVSLQTAPASQATAATAVSGAPQLAEPPQTSVREDAGVNQQQGQSAASSSVGNVPKQVSSTGGSAAAAAPLTKGFLLGASKQQRSSDGKHIAATTDAAAGAKQQQGSGLQATEPGPKQSRAEAFTGQVVEKVTPSTVAGVPAVSSVPAVSQSQTASSHIASQVEDTTAPRVSKFKLMRQAARQP